MKKTLLSVVAAGLVATAVAPAALANEFVVSKNANTEEEFVLTQEVKDEFTSEKAKDKFVSTLRPGETALFNGERVVGKAKATTKAPAAKAAGKVLPKTSAVK